jgi:hypothetical protein
VGFLEDSTTIVFKQTDAAKHSIPMGFPQAYVHGDTPFLRRTLTFIDGCNHLILNKMYLMMQP